ALSHTLLAVERISWAIDWLRSREVNIPLSQEDRLCLGYAALFHDIGKRDAYSEDEEERVHFYHHEDFSSQAAEGIMKRLRFSNLLREKTIHIVRNHMRLLNLSRETKETALKRLAHQTGEEIPLLVIHTLADKEASRGVLSLQRDEVVENHCLRLMELFRQEEIVRPASLVRGKDVMALGYQEGPKIGEILDHIRKKQVEGEIRTREEAIILLREKFGLK
ncbi:MAG: HD domain-containing protein, partial [Deltaproteobacteria bacterium]